MQNGTTLTDRQQHLLDILRNHRRRGHSPTVRELMGLLGVRSPNGVVCHLGALVRKGLIVRDGKGVSRNIRLADEGDYAADLLRRAMEYVPPKHELAQEIRTFLGEDHA